MCGIMGYVGSREATAILMNGLKRLEYRGYDSAGVAVIENGAVEMRRSEGKLVNLEKVLAADPCNGTIGIGHTRWATHGRPSEINAHPHKADRIVVVHNGIIENYLALRERLVERGRVFSSETDTEIIAHLIDEYIKEGNDFETAVRLALADIRGSYAIGVLDEGDQSKLIGARSACPLVVGLGKDEYFLASDIPALLEHTREMIFLDDGEIVVLDPSGYRFVDLDGGMIEHEVRRIEWTLLQAEKAGYKHFMLKEIYEQPQAVTDTFRGRIYPDEGEVYLESALTEDQYRAAERLIIVACGTSYHAALVAKFMIEELCRIPVEVDLASEFRYRNPLVDDATLLVSISQSGETADTIAAQEEAASRGATTLTICNVVDSSIVRKADGVVYTHAGPEISVASTKAFTTQLTALYLLALRLGRLNGSLDRDRTRGLLEELIRLPQVMEEVLKQDDLIQKIAKKTMHFSDFLYLGRGSTYPIALEGALKLKEISYIHAEGYPAGEMKHGPIALIDENLPVVVAAPKGATYEKILGNMEEAKSRGGYLIVLANAGDDDVAAKADDLIVIPPMNAHLAPIPMVLPLQLLAYHIATLKGTDVDQPRNLAKSVTVE